MEKSDSKSRNTTFKISLKERPDFKGDLSAFVFDSVGNLLSQAPVEANKVAFDLPREQIARARVFIAPTTETLKESTILTMHRLNAYEAQVAYGGTLIEEIGVPGVIIDGWPQCGCLIHGKVVRSSDNRGVCGARVHICEVEKMSRWIMQLPPNEVYQIRDDLITIIRNPPPPTPGPVGPVIGPSPYIAGMSPVPEPPNKTRPLYRLKASAPTAGHDAVLPHGILSAKALGPQPIPPGVGGQLLSLPESWSKLEAELTYANSATEVQRVLTDNWKVVGMLLCQLHERIWRLRCDEVAVVTTDNQGRFEAHLSYPCVEDRPDYYFWVEYEFEAGFETVYKPPMACNTHWDYLCGSEVILPVFDSRIPGCTAYPDLPGCEVWVLSIGNEVAIQEVHQTEGAGQGLTTANQPFGGTLEPRVEFSRSALSEKGVKFYRWSYRRLSGPDGVSTTSSDLSVPVSTEQDAADAPASDWTPLTRDVFRHYKEATGYPSYLVGPLPIGVVERTAPKPNLFEIHPAYPPNYPDYEDAYWRVLNSHVDLADAYFETASLPGSPERGPTEEEGQAPDDLAAGRYELKLELFDGIGELVNWKDMDIDLCIMNADAPFGENDYEPIAAPTNNRIMTDSEDLMGFKMVVRVDNNHCYAEIQPVAGDVEPDPECGFHTYESGDEIGLGFIARHPNHFATYTFNTNRSVGPDLEIAYTSGTAGESDANGYDLVGDFGYQKLVVETELRGSCTNAAFGEHLEVKAMATNGYATRLWYLDHEDTAAFALAEPCDREDE